MARRDPPAVRKNRPGSSPTSPEPTSWLAACTSSRTAAQRMPWARRRDTCRDRCAYRPRRRRTRPHAALARRARHLHARHRRTLRATAASRLLRSDDPRSLRFLRAHDGHARILGPLHGARRNRATGRPSTTGRVSSSISRRIPRSRRSSTPRWSANRAPCCLPSRPRTTSAASARSPMSAAGAATCSS